MHNALQSNTLLLRLTTGFTIRKSFPCRNSDYEYFFSRPTFYNVSDLRDA